jgi:hypothetical protein
MFCGGGRGVARPQGRKATRARWAVGTQLRWGRGPSWTGGAGVRPFGLRAPLAVRHRLPGGPGEMPSCASMTQ